MDSRVATLFFRQLFSHACSHRCTTAPWLLTSQQTRRPAGTYSGKRLDGRGDETAWQRRTDILPEDKLAEYKKYDMVTADDLRGKKRRPKRTKMLMRDFVEDSLYNSAYGYFSDQATIFDAGEPFDFKNMRNEAEFESVLGERYVSFEDRLDKEKYNETRQLWHTPTELFRPHYAEAMARYLVANYKISLYPYHDLILYEVGAGNGSFMLSVLDFIRDTSPEVYERTKYKIIEISPALAALQKSRLQGTAESRGHVHKVEVVNQSIFSWDKRVSSPCYFLAMEVIDNFAHDAIRYNAVTEEPLQSIVLIDTDGEFYEFYSPDVDPVAARFIRVRDAACSFPYNYPLRSSRLMRNIRSRLPLSPNLTPPEYIPTRLMQFFDVLQRYFPAHKLLLSDFHSLPDSVPGFNAPVVQTRFQRRTIPVSTPLVRQGYFDILFPTDFAVMEAMYRAITGKLTRCVTHEDFMKSWADVAETTTKSGESPLLTWYQNASVMTSL